MTLRFWYFANNLLAFFVFFRLSFGDAWRLGDKLARVVLDWGYLTKRTVCLKLNL